MENPSSSHEQRILSILAVALFFIVQSLGIYLNSGMYRMPPLHTGLAALTHYGGMAVFALLLPRLAEHGRGTGLKALLAPVPLLLLICMAMVFCSHVFFAGSRVLVVILGRPACLGLFLAAALHVFFLSVREHRGLFLGLALGASELVWLVLLPGMSVEIPTSTDPAFFAYAHKIQAVFQTAMGGLIVAAMVWRTASGALNSLSADPEEAPAATAACLEGPSLAVMFTAGVVLHVLFGFSFNQPFPRVMPGAGAQEDLHLILLFSAPLAGIILDRCGIRPVLIMLACMTVAGPLSFLAQSEGTRALLYEIFCAERQVFFLIGLVLAGRFARKPSQRLLICCMFYAVQSLALVGVMLGRVGAGVFLGGVLAAAAVLLLLRLRRDMTGLEECLDETGPKDTREAASTFLSEPGFFGHAPSELSSAPSFGISPAHASEFSCEVRPLPVSGVMPAYSGLAAFVREHGLSEQEERVMVMLAQGRSTGEIAAGMGCKSPTIRTYVHRLFKKTGAASRRDLVNMLAASAAGGAGEKSLGLNPPEIGDTAG